MKNPAAAIAFGIIAMWCWIFLANAYLYARMHAGNLPSLDTSQAFTLAGRGQQLTYAAVGDSLTAGTGVSSYAETFPYLLAEKLAQGGPVSLRVYATPGFTTRDIRARAANVAESDPDIITLLIGTNDIHRRVSSAEFEENYRAILDELSKTGAKVYAISIPYLGSRTLALPPLNLYFDARTRELNAIIARVAPAYNAIYVDMAEPTKSAMRLDEFYSGDSFHPNEKGYRLWADTLYAHIHR